MEIELVGMAGIPEADLLAREGATKGEYQNTFIHTYKQEYLSYSIIFLFLVL